MEQRKRNFACVLYEESVPPDFREIINSWHVPCFLSPYHDKDVNPTGECKKPHWHLLLTFDNVKSREQAKALFDQVDGVGCEVVESVRGYARYLCHLDNPEKAQYSLNDVVSFSGADYQNIILLETDKVKLIAEMEAFIDANQIYSYREFKTYCRLHNYTWFRALSINCSTVILYFIKSKQWEVDKNYTSALLQQLDGGDCDESL